MVRRYEPMLLRPTDELPDDDGWIFEPKLNGYRALAYVAAERTRLISRQGNDFSYLFPDVVTQLPGSLSEHAAVLDGEVVGLGEDGRHNLRTLRDLTSRIVYFTFDMLEFDGEPLVSNPWRERHQKLEESVIAGSHVEICPHYPHEERDDLLLAARGLALEGVVAKKIDSRYWSGRRRIDWQKYKFDKRRSAWT